MGFSSGLGVVCLVAIIGAMIEEKKMDSTTIGMTMIVNNSGSVKNFPVGFIFIS